METNKALENGKWKLEEMGRGTRWDKGWIGEGWMRWRMDRGRGEDGDSLKWKWKKGCEEIESWRGGMEKETSDMDGKRNL